MVTGISSGKANELLTHMLVILQGTARAALSLVPISHIDADRIHNDIVSMDFQGSSLIDKD